MFMWCCCWAQTNSYNLVTFYTQLSGDVSLVCKLVHKLLIKQRCNCPGQLATFEHWTNFAKTCEDQFRCKRPDDKKVHVWLDYKLSKVAPTQGSCQV